MLEVQVVPREAQVALVDATWQDYPQWDSSEQDVAFRAASLIDPDHAPYPGFAVATRPDVRSGSTGTVDVELWTTDRPQGLRLILRSVMAVGGSGLMLGNEESALTPVDFPAGTYPIEIWVDGCMSPLAWWESGPP